MDVKGAIRNILPFAQPTASEVKRKQEASNQNRQTEATADREGNGQSQGNGEEARRNLSEEEIQEAIKILEALPGVKDNGLTFKLVRTDGVPVVYVEDRTGKVVRRIPETEVSQVKSRTGGEKKTGNLLNKTM